MAIPFVDLKAQYLSIQNEIDTVMREVIMTSAYIGGHYVQQFENDFAEYTALKHVISCANGTDAIEMLLQSMHVGVGDEVIVPALSWISTSEAVSNIGATPVFVDIEPEYFTIDPALIENKITAKTKVIIPVHLYGQPANMPLIMQIAGKYKLKVLEDCAQSHGAMIAGKRTGTYGDCASYSFYPGKNLGAFGDAGAMVTNNDEVAERARMIANHGQKGKHNHIIEGRNSRMDGLQGAILSVKLRFIEKWTSMRIDWANEYFIQLKDAECHLPLARNDSRHVFHLFVIRTSKRDELAKYMKSKGIETAIHYPTALPFLTCYSGRGNRPADFPVAYEYVQHILSLPMYAELTKEMVGEITRSLKGFPK